jgi:hypothetical protein
LRCTNTVPAPSPMSSLAGTRASAQPIHKYLRQDENRPRKRSERERERESQRRPSQPQSKPPRVRLNKAAREM